MIRIFIFALLLMAFNSFADETATTDTSSVTPTVSTSPPPTLSAEKIAELKKLGWNDAQIDKLKSMMNASGKSADEIILMRKDKRMGWGRIAHELGVHPGELGRGRHKEHHARHEEKMHEHEDGNSSEHGHGNGKGKGK